MTWLWIILWIGLSSIILGAFLWSTVILQRQKKAWKAFADKHKLQYDNGRLMESPTVTGVINDFGVSCFTAMRDPDDMRSRRYVSVIEIKLPQGLVGSEAVGTKEMIWFLQTLTALKPHTLKSEAWDAEKYYFFTSDETLSEKYWTDDRIKHLISILNLKNAEVVLMHDGNEALIRVETTDPIQETEKAEKVINFLIKQSKGIMVSEEEKKALLKTA